MESKSVVVVGGGAIGLCAAWQLAELGASVTVIEKASVGSGSTGLSAGVIETQYVDPIDIELRVRSMEIFESLERDHGLHVTRYGYLRLAHTPDQLAAFEESVTTQTRLGVKDARVVSPGEIEALYPEIQSEGIIGGLFGPSDGYIDGYLYCQLLGELCQARGVALLQRAPLTGYERTAAGQHRVSTPRGEIVCDVVVNAAGAWAGEVGETLGLPCPVLPQRHQAVFAHLGTPPQYRFPTIIDYTPGSGEEGLYVRYENANRLILGLHSEEVVHDVADPNSYFSGVDDEYVEAVASKLIERFPGFGDVAGFRDGWAGLYPVSPDGRAQLGPHPEDETVIVATGGGGAGLQISPVLGRLVGEWVLSDTQTSTELAEALRPRAEFFGRGEARSL